MSGQPLFGSRATPEALCVQAENWPVLTHVAQKTGGRFLRWSGQRIGVRWRGSPSLHRILRRAGEHQGALLGAETGRGPGLQVRDGAGTGVHEAP